ncbi:phosphoglycerate kinase [Parelaphostrongylus tenuis]|uniref:phosphoglycerate kinase n=1 Tax=Parelaphostrongylus tenuis TaxID=148309 RepID=A0AAD5MZH8_PARTN|nr:phosphoglycerate kinase [Parelaphostrongylus tenuis]
MVDKGAKIVKDLLAKAKEKNVKIHLPVDVVAGDKFAEDASSKVVTLAEGVPAGLYIRELRRLSNCPVFILFSATGRIIVSK